MKMKYTSLTKFAAKLKWMKYTQLLITLISEFMAPYVDITDPQKWDFNGKWSLSASTLVFLIISLALFYIYF